jgi:hypothetical protein
VDSLENWSSVEAGKIPTSELVLSNGVVDEESLQMVREEKLATMLAQDVLTMEAMWTDYENEETQVKIDLSDIVLDYLLQRYLIILQYVPPAPAVYLYSSTTPPICLKSSFYFPAHT